ncbi:CaiB/BaiF CoA-transferase family protein [Devosia ginsengisoli]|uniref:CoA transferase n=1 Tax=Devosia ginsengisoli TaxID=400770 RepID=A0A5B8LN54_9HYPH|nr:CoA transferase [Devosia ginsengisoli]QDZ09496.1 CoA transferase [Devosia ginsengisoli]
MQRTERPLAGLIVVDLMNGSLAAIGRTLAELGAEVVLVETASSARPGAEDRRRQIEFAVGNVGKQSVVVDLDTPRGRASLDALIARADILIEDASPAAEVQLDLNDIRDRYQTLTVLSVSDFGRDNVFSGYQATDPVLHALSSELARSGIKGRIPLLPPGQLAYATAATQATFAVLLAYYNRLRTGWGDWLDFSALDGVSQALDPGFGIGGSATQGGRPSDMPRDRPPRGQLYPIIDCADGKVRICVLSPRQWQSLHRLMGSPEAFADPAFGNTKVRRESEALNEAIAAHFATMTRKELEIAGETFGVPIGAVLSLEEAVVTEHMQARETLTTVADGFGGTIQLTNGALEINGVRMGPPKHVSARGADSVKIGGKPLGAHRQGPKPGKRPLEGIRVLDLGVIVVGAEQGRLLADYGADVIKVEAKAFPDGGRQTLNGEPLSMGFAAGHRNKRSLGLNLKSEEGRKLFLRLAEKADVILSNFKAGTLESLGLGYDVVSQINPEIIMVDSSAFGPTGPWSRRMGYGPLVRANAGLTDLWRYPDDPESYSDSVTIYPDHTAARVGVVAILAMLIARLGHGRGGRVSIAQAEIMLNQMSEQIALVGEGLPLEPADAPWGVFPCKGDDEWCVITVRNDADWQALNAVTGWSKVLGDTRLATREGRHVHREHIEAALRQWLADKTPHEAMAILQQAGVPAAAMFRVHDLMEQFYFGQRSFLRSETHPHIPGSYLVERHSIVSHDLAEPPMGAAPLMGQHTTEVVRDWLRLTGAETDRLVAAGVLEPIEQPVAAE